MSPTQGSKVQRRLAAIFAADVEGYSRLMGLDEVGMLRTLTAHREIMDRLIGEHRGRIANTAGDSVLAEFPSVVDAVLRAREGLVS
jgi:adenylate cyclase